MSLHAKWYFFSLSFWLRYMAQMKSIAISYVTRAENMSECIRSPFFGSFRRRFRCCVRFSSIVCLRLRVCVHVRRRRWSASWRAYDVFGFLRVFLYYFCRFSVVRFSFAFFLSSFFFLRSECFFDARRRFNWHECAAQFKILMENIAAARISINFSGKREMVWRKRFIDFQQKLKITERRRTRRSFSLLDSCVSFGVVFVLLFYFVFVDIWKWRFCYGCTATTRQQMHTDEWWWYKALR